MKADFIIKNGHVFCSGLTEPVRFEQALAVKDGKIVAVGSDKDIMSGWDAEEVLDAEGCTVLPGMCDSHVHCASTVEFTDAVDLSQIERKPNESRSDFIERTIVAVRDFAEANPDLTSIHGTGWNPAFYIEDAEGYPTCHDLSKACEDRPIFIDSYCHHWMWVNENALRESGIDKNTEVLQGYVIHKDKEGNPIGLFQDFPAIDELKRRCAEAEYSVEAFKRGILSYQNDYALPNGITMAFDAVLKDNSMKAYKELADEGKLKMRFRASYMADPSLPEEQYDKIINYRNEWSSGDMFKIDTVKFFIDGGELTFSLNEPFEKGALKKNGLPENYTGPIFWPADQLKAAFLKVAKAGMQIHVHAMGDGAVKQALDGFEYLAEQGLTGIRSVIAHVMLISDDDIKRMKKLGVIAAMQPHWGQYSEFDEVFSKSLLGTERSYNLYPTGELVHGGVTCSAGTDFPVLPEYNTLKLMRDGMTRLFRKDSPEYGRFPEAEKEMAKNAITLDEMLMLRTINGAYQLFLENETGSIAAGKSADLVFLDRNISQIPTDEIEAAKIKKVMIKGEAVFG